jgi:predicted ferric reductase
MVLSTSSTPHLPIFIPDLDDIHANTSASNHDPFKYSHGLTGVDQPSNYLFVNILFATALVPATIAIILRAITALRSERRRISTISSRRSHDFWKKDRYSCWGYIKRHFVYAPIWKGRHNREIRLSSAFILGTLPTRPQLLIIAVYVLSNIAYCIAIPEQPLPQKFAEFRGRCGALAAFNLIFTILFALRNNPFIQILHVSYDTFNLFHRWTARLMILESIAHVFAFACNAYSVTYDGHGGWDSITWVLRHSLSYRLGLTAFVAFGLMLLHSIGPFRHAFYETFLSLHRLGVIVAVAGIYFHLAKHALPQLPWIYLCITFLVLELAIRTGRIVYFNSSWRRRSCTQVTLEALPGEATRVTLSLPRSWNANPGSHVHIYIPRIALWSSHPFSIAWSQSSRYARLSEKLPSSIEDLEIEQGPSTVSCIVRARTGMSRKLFRYASQADDKHASLWGAIEGPYGGYHPLDSYGTIVLFAAGVGITHQLPFVRHLLSGHNSHTSATQKILLVWCIQHTEALEWIQPWLEELSCMQHFSDVVRIRVYVSRMSAISIGTVPLPDCVDVRPQRCEPQRIVDEEVVAQVGAMVVSVCGPGEFGDSVREAVRRRVCIRSVDFIEEAFSY